MRFCQRNIIHFETCENEDTHGKQFNLMLKKITTYCIAPFPTFAIDDSGSLMIERRPSTISSRDL